MMPGLDGSEVCRRLRERDWGPYTYIILLTAKDRKEDVVAGLDTGADDYVTKPFNPQELRSRIRAGKRILDLEIAYRDKVREAQEAMSHVRQLQGLLPICMHCRKVRDDGDTWRRLESYVEAHTGTSFSHSLCGECLKEHYPEAAAEEKSSV
jgi:DNA-binding response OmpR family regulator